MISFNLIGPGRAGLALAKALSHTSQYTVQGIFHPTYSAAKKAVECIGAGEAFDKLEDLPAAHLTCIATPDDRIKHTAALLAQAHRFNPRALVFHLSGILSLDALTPLKTKGLHVACLHPLKAFSKTSYLEAAPFKAVDCALEIDEADTYAKTTLLALSQAIEASPFPILASQKTLYHAAAIMASNYLVTLANESMQLMQAAGIPEDKAHGLCARLMQTSLDNIKNASTPADALTGPIARGDIQTIEKHLLHIKHQSTASLYCAAGLATQNLSHQSPEIKAALRELFNTRLV